MADNAAGLRAVVSRLEQLDDQGRPAPKTPLFFARDLARLNKALQPWLLFEDGEPIGYDPLAPADLLRVYGELTSYGYAQGWL